MRKSQEIETAFISQQNSYTSEVEGLKRLTDLYKRHFEEATTKVEELEQSLSSVREVHNTKINKYKEELKSLIEERDSAFAEERKALKTRIVELETKLSSLPILSVDELQQAVVEPPKLSNIQDIAGLSITEMYDKVVHLEKDLHQERLRRKEMETYMNQMLKDIEQKAPIIAKQRRDYQRIVQSHTELTGKLDAVVVENGQLKQVLKDLEKRTVDAERETDLLNAHNRDLARQLQHLLSSHSQSSHQRPVALIEDVNPSDESEAQGIISNHLVVFSNVEELQQRNAELLCVIRKLTDEKEASATATGAHMEVEHDDDQNTLLQSALVELSELKDHRQRTEEMLAVLLQQRDMYRAMLEGDVATGNAEENLPSTAGNFATPMKLLTDRRQSFGTPKGSVFGTPGGENNNLVKELQLKLDYSEDEKRRVQERLQRYEEAEKVLHESLDKIRQDLTSSKMESAQHHSEAKFLKERVDRLESALALSQQEGKNTLQRRMELEKSLLEYQREVRVREDSLTTVREELRQSQDQMRRQEIELEVTKQSESRLIQQVNEAREEVKRHANLTDYLHRIEAGLQSRSEEEKETLLRERDSLKKAYETLRKQVDDKNAIDEQKSKAVDDELRSLRTKLEVKVSEVSSLNEAIIKEQSVAKASQERSALLEKQLTIAQDKLNMLQGNSIVESLIEKEMAEKEIALQQAKNEVESLRSQLQSAEIHVDQFRKLSSANEQALKDIHTKFQEFQVRAEQEVKSYDEEIQRLRQESHEHRQSSQQLIQDLEANQDALIKLKQSHQDEVNILQEEKQLLSIENDAAKAQLATINLDASKFQQQAKLAYENYERELQLHAQAERELRDERQAVESIKKQLNQVQDQASSLAAETLRLSRQLQDEKVNSQEEKKRLQDEIDSLTKTNDLLHAQVQSFGLQLEKIHEARLQLHGASVSNLVESSMAIEGETGLGTASANTVLDGSGSGASVSAGEFDEITELRKSASEMREVLRFMKREKEMLQARLNIAESENNRYVNQLQSLSKSLDEARTELKKELESRQLSVSNQQEYQKLLQEVNQLNLLRESNQHLRGENEELSKKLTVVTASLDEERKKFSPLEDTIRKLQGEKDGLEMVNDQLSNDVGYWKNRLHTLVSRYNDVDPEEHRLLKTKLDESIVKITDLEGQLAAMQTDHVQQLKSIQDQLKTVQDAMQQKERQLTTSEQSNENLRQKLRQFKTMIETKNEDLNKANAAKDTLREGLEKEVAEAQLKNASLTSQVQDLSTKLESANTSLSKMTAALQKANEQRAAANTNLPAPSVAVPTSTDSTPPPPTTAPPATSAAAAIPPTPAAVPTPARPVTRTTAQATPVAAKSAPAVTHVVAAPTLSTPAAPTAPAVEPIEASADAPAPSTTSSEVVQPIATAPTTAAPVPDKAAQLKQALMKGGNKRRPAGANTANPASTGNAPLAAAPAAQPTPTIPPPLAEESTSTKNSTADVGVEAEGAPSAKKGRSETPVETIAPPLAPATEIASEVAAPGPTSAPISIACPSEPAGPQPSFIAPVASQMSMGGADVPALTVTGTPSLEEGEENESGTVVKTDPLIKVTAPVLSSAAATANSFSNNNPFARAAPISVVGGVASPPAVFGSNTSLFGSGASKPAAGPFTTPSTGGGIFGSKPTASSSPFGFSAKPVGVEGGDKSAAGGSKPSVFGTGSFGFGGATTATPVTTGGPSLFGAAAAATQAGPSSGFGGSLFGGSTIFGAAPSPDQPPAETKVHCSIGSWFFT